MNEIQSRFLLIYSDFKSGQRGFWMADLSEKIDLVNEASYKDLWIQSASSQPLTLTPSLGPVLRGKMASDDFGASRSLRDDFIIRNFAQESRFINASNEIPANELPCYLGSRSITTPISLHVTLNIIAKRYWDLPDVRARIHRQKILLEDSYWDPKCPVQPNSEGSSKSTITARWEKAARQKVLPAGLFLPVKVEASKSTIPAFIRLDADAVRNEIPATLFPSITIEHLEKHTKVTRRAYFDCLGQHAEAMDEIGTISNGKDIDLG